MCAMEGRGAAGVISMSNGAASGVDLEKVKQNQQKTWASGDFSVVASRVVWVSELLMETADVQAGERVLDVATGSGNAAIAAARRNAQAVGVDYVPALLERGRVRARAEHLSVEFVEGDAEALPFEAGSFDVVSSAFGAMFAPNHEKAASELLRVCRSGGRIALASWTPEGFLGETFRLMGRYLPPTPGVPPSVLWGDAAYLESLFGRGAKSITSSKRICKFKWRSAEENLAFFRAYYGPTIKAFEKLTDERRGALSAELVDLALRFDANKGGGPISIQGEYLESIIVKR